MQTVGCLFGFSFVARQQVKQERTGGPLGQASAQTPSSVFSLSIDHILTFGEEMVT
jgi:hypothetical protein